MQKIVIIGAGISGQAAARLAIIKKFQVTLIDQYSNDKLVLVKERFEKTNAQVILAIEISKATTLCQNADLIVISPGIPPEGFFKQALLSTNAKVISELEFAYQFCMCPILAITGTNGKTTTTEITTHLLTCAGKRTIAAGNIGYPFSDAVIMSENLDCIVLEVSSFQLENIIHFKALASVITNITSDHINRYKDFNHYAETKINLLQNFTEKNNSLAHESLKPLINFPCQYYSLLSATMIDKERLLIKGNHNLENAFAALWLAKKIVENATNLEEYLYSYKPSAHRLEVIFQNEQLTIINDSKSTNSDSLIKAIEAVGRHKNLILIAGGKDKMMDFEPTTKVVKNYVKSAILIGESKHILKSLWNNATECILAENLDDAINQAFQCLAPKDILLLSPGFASQDMFIDYKDRGEQFRTAVLRRVK